MTESGDCPKCGNGDLDYETSELCDNYIAYPYTCNKCGFGGKEWYRLEFIGHWDTDGNEL